MSAPRFTKPELNAINVALDGEKLLEIAEEAKKRENN